MARGTVGDCGRLFCVLMCMTESIVIAEGGKKNHINFEIIALMVRVQRRSADFENYIKSQDDNIYFSIKIYSIRLCGAWRRGDQGDTSIL